MEKQPDNKEEKVRRQDKSVRSLNKWPAIKSGRTSEKSTGKSSARDSGKDSGKNAGKSPVNSSGKYSGRGSGKVSEKSTDKYSGKRSGKNSGKNSGKRSGKRLRRKTIVLVEWAAIVCAVILLLAGGIRFLFFRDNNKKDEVSTEVLLQTETESGMKNDGTCLLSFAGDCTIGSLLEWQGEIEEDFHSVVGDDYAYPFSGVKEIFEKDDLTTVNFEGTLTTSDDAVEKPYRFKADPSYVQVLTEGSVEAVSLANNHSGDFKDQGRADTYAALDSAGILYTNAGMPLIGTLDSGLKIGIVSYNTVDNNEGEWAWRSSVQADIEKCKAQDCNLIIGFMHWGSVEYLTEPEAWEVQFAHDMADWGCDLIVGGHAHILQRMEYYNDVPIFYSMGNFCFGGNTDPDDKDSVIVQAQYTWKRGDDKPVRSDLRVIPCMISSRSDLNDYCPTPCKEGSEDYQRILGKLQWNQN